MSFTKREYIKNQTTITADNLNAIQDEIITHESKFNDYLLRQGGALTGNLSLNGNDIDAVGSIFLRQSENNEGVFFTFEGTPTAPQCVFYGTNGDEPVELKGVASPTEESSAATKRYVDDVAAGYLPLSGGQLTGNLNGNYLTGTWLQTTSATESGKPSKIATIDSNGWIYYRTLEHLKDDLGVETSTPDYIQTEAMRVANAVMAFTGKPEAKPAGPAYTNQLPLATDANGDIFNTIGYQNNVRLSSSGIIQSANEYSVTGFIPIVGEQGPTIYLKDFPLLEQGTHRVAIYNAEKELLRVVGCNALTGYSGGTESGNWSKDSTTGYFTKFKISNSYSSDQSFSQSDIRYIRICGNALNSNSIVTVNEPIVDSAEIPASTPKPMFSMAFLTDMHCNYYLDLTNAAQTDAGKGLGELQKYLHLDAVVMGGDYSTGAISSTAETTADDINICKGLIKPYIGATPALWLKGNHDDAPYRGSIGRINKYALFSRIGNESLCNRDIVINPSDPQNFYGYLDFPHQKIRLIYLNTDDKDSFESGVSASSSDVDYLNSHHVGEAQLNWLQSSALNLTDKDDESSWGIIVVSHCPLNYTSSYSYNDVTYSSSTASVATVLQNYSGQAKILFCVNGHSHKLNDGLYGTIPYIECPNVLDGRERQSKDGQTYTKTAGTATSTAFTILVLDRANAKVHAIHYGAGYDRTIAIPALS